MQYIADAREAKEIDRISIQDVGIPSLVLMEKAAMAVVACVKTHSGKHEDILVVCGSGNNGGDGVAAARMLWEEGYSVQILLVGEERDASPETASQIRIARNLGVRIGTTLPTKEYDIILDALFGIGLSRKVSGKYAQIIQWINQQDATVYSIDIPSGVCATTGNILGIAVMAHYTITFGVNKRGLVLYPGCSCCGQVSVVDIGFPKMAVTQVSPFSYTLTKEEARELMPVRKLRSNKGSYGRVLVIAGSQEMSGACYFAAAAAYRVGCGLVKVLTARDNSQVLRTRLPEAIVTTYQEGKLPNTVSEELEWADVIVIGPGIGCGATAESLLDMVLQIRDKTVVIDADGLNLLAQKEEYFCKRGDGGRRICLPGNFILTPHMKEMSRLVQVEVPVLQKEIISQALLSIDSTFDGGNKILNGLKRAEHPVMVLKDAKTVVTDGEDVFINTTGNSGLATGGSGDVLAGMIAGILAQNVTPKRAAVLGVCFHGMAAEAYLEKGNRYSMMASDILRELPLVLPE